MSSAKDGPPDVIYLQWNPDEDERESVIEPDGEGVTWCEDRIYTGDVKYVRVRESEQPRPEGE